MIGLAQDADRVAFGLAVELREHRPDALDPLDEPARRHRGRAVQQELERRKIGRCQPGMIEQHIDHRRYEQREIDFFARDGGQHGFGVEALEHVDGTPPRISVGSTFVPATWLIGATAR